MHVLLINDTDAYLIFVTDATDRRHIFFIYQCFSLFWGYLSFFGGVKLQSKQFGSVKEMTNMSNELMFTLLLPMDSIGLAFGSQLIAEDEL